MGGWLRRHASATRPGYSLLEVMVVVAILGVAATLSGPSITRMIAGQQAQQVVRGLITEFGAMRADAFLRSTPYDADMMSARLSATTPEGWDVQVDESASLAASGYCTPGAVYVYAPSGRRWSFQINRGDCEIRSSDGV